MFPPTYLIPKKRYKSIDQKVYSAYNAYYEVKPMFITISLRFSRQRSYLSQIFAYMYRRVRPDSQGIKVGFFVADFVIPDVIATRLFPGDN